MFKLSNNALYMYILLFCKSLYGNVSVFFENRIHSVNGELDAVIIATCDVAVI